MGIWEGTVEISRAEIEFIHGSLKRGKKKQLAAHLGIKPALLSRYLNYKQTKHFNGFKMPAEVYNKILEFLKTSN